MQSGFSGKGVTRSYKELKKVKRDYSLNSKKKRFGKHKKERKKEVKKVIEYNKKHYICVVFMKRHRYFYF
ncbi:hypothetical protein FACS1894203_2080 [Bacteroidia bacterium]|nr:hypothetical protein FACS1894203_2080 [Bacteroidia bacterium]